MNKLWIMSNVDNLSSSLHFSFLAIWIKFEKGPDKFKAVLALDLPQLKQRLNHGEIP